MSARLAPLTPGAAPTIPIQRPVVLVGRHPECDVRIDLSKISRRHCCLAQVYNRLVIRDLGSLNGLRVNGRLVEEAELRAGDEVAIGPIIYRVETEVQATAPPSLKAVPPVPPPSLPAFPRHGDDSGDLIPLDV